jgi:hypothetical protein
LASLQPCMNCVSSFGGAPELQPYQGVVATVAIISCLSASRALASALLTTGGAVAGSSRSDSLSVSRTSTVQLPPFQVTSTSMQNPARGFLLQACVANATSSTDKEQCRPRNSREWMAADDLPTNNRHAGVPPSYLKLRTSTSAVGNEQTR